MEWTEPSLINIDLDQKNNFKFFEETNNIGNF